MHEVLYIEELTTSHGFTLVFDHGGFTQHDTMQALLEEAAKHGITITRSDHSKAANGLRREVQGWIRRNFNAIPLEVIQSLAEHTEGLDCYLAYPLTKVQRVERWMEHTSLEPKDLEKYWSGWSTDPFDPTVTDEGFQEHVYNEESDLIEEVLNDMDVYDQYQPTWGTVFEIDDGLPSGWNELCAKRGITVIDPELPYGGEGKGSPDDPLCSLSPMLAFSSGGHSFYSAYWIPLYLGLYPSSASKWAGVDYEMV